MENTYRAVNIALTLEWAFRGTDRVDIFKVREAIRKRKGTHDNLLRPSLGVGGYCLTKDPVLANWAMQTLFGLEGSLKWPSAASTSTTPCPCTPSRSSSANLKA